MRRILAAGVATLMMACGGDSKPAEQQPATPAPAADQPAPAATGQTHTVDMVLEGKDYKFVPAELTVKPGDVVHFINKSGGPHNVSFWPDSIPAGAAAAISMPETTGELQGPMIVTPDATYDVTIGPNAPAGDYKFYCLPHLAFKMTGKLTVQQ